MVTGDSLIEKVSEGNFRVLTMKNYVIKRDSAGKILELIIKEKLSYASVPENIKSGIKEEDKNEDIELYTYVYLEDGSYNRRQEINDVIVTGSETTLKTLSKTYISLRWNKVDGEDYGRGFVEENLGTFIALEKQLQVLNESAVVSSKTVYTVNPNGMTKYNDFVKAKNGDAIIGHEGDIGTIRTNKGTDLQITHSLVNEYKKELAEAFLSAGASVRDAERVTKAEVQMIASDLEASFGGIYTSVAESIQIPLIENAMSELNIDGGDDVDVIITAGVEALGRNIEMAKINSLLNELATFGSLVGIENVAKTINIPAVTSAMIANSGVASKGFLLSKAQVDQVDKDIKEEALANKVMDSAVPQASEQIMKGEQA